MAEDGPGSGDRGDNGKYVGFLFGNIDRRGRLEEDYLDQDEKDHLGNVAGSIARDHGKEMEDVAARRSQGADVVSEDYDDDDDSGPDEADKELQERNAQATDYGDEREMVEDDLEPGEKDAYARIALEAAQNPRTASAEVEEDYDEESDDDEDPSKGQQSQSTAVRPSAPEVKVVAIEPRKVSVSVPPPEHVDMNRRPGKGEPPIFGRLFSQRPRRIPARRRRRRAAPMPTNLTGPAVVACQAESDHDDDPVVQRKDTRPEPQEVNEDEEDSDDSDEWFSSTLSARLKQGRHLGYTEEESNGLTAIASQPLRPLGAKIPEAEVSSAGHYLMVQTAWEDDIVWGENDSDPKDDMDVDEERENESAPGDEGDSDLEEDLEWDEEPGGDTQDANCEKKEEADTAVPSPQVESADPPPPLPLPPPPPPPVPFRPASPADVVTEGAPKAAPNLQLEMAVPPNAGETDLATGEEQKKEDDAEQSTDGKKSRKKDPKKGKDQPLSAQPVGAPAVRVEKPVDEALVRYVRQNMPHNLDLEDGLWLDQVVWDSSDEAREDLENRFSQLILDRNDPVILLQSAAKVVAKPKPQQYVVGESGDPFVISNDRHYHLAGSTTNRRALRKTALRGLRSSPAAEKSNTTDAVPKTEYLFNFHRPVASQAIVGSSGQLQFIRRRRPKAGPAQIAGQIPKKRIELSCATKDPFRVSLFEYCVERTPVILPISGTGSRLVTYARKSSSQAATQASVNAQGTADADTVFMAPEDPPPLHAGDIKVDHPPLSVLESNLGSAPALKQGTRSTDFLLVRRDGKYFVREIDSMLSIGSVEPRVEVISPNTERFKRYVKDRVLLWILREFLKQKKAGSSKPSLKKSDVYEAFDRRRTYPETSLVKTLKELSSFEHGNYFVQEPDKGFAALEAELLRTVTPEETAAFESMEAGWEILVRHGVQVFTHPTSQGNMISAASKTGDDAKEAVGNYIRQLLMKAPWHRSQIMIANQRAQRKDMINQLQLAKTANDLTGPFAKAQSRINQMSTSDIYNLLNQHFKVPGRKIPTDIGERRQVLTEMVLKSRRTTMEKVDLSTVIEEVIARHKIHASVARGGERKDPGLIQEAIPLADQLDALVSGNVSALPLEDDGTIDVSNVIQPKMDGDGRFGVFNGEGGDRIGTLDSGRKKTLRITSFITDEKTGMKRKVQKVISDPIEIAKVEEQRRQEQAAKKRKPVDAVRTSSDNPLKISIGLNALSRRPSTSSTASKPKVPKPAKPVVPKKPKVPKNKTVGTIKINTKKIAKQIREKEAKRRRAQYSDELAVPRKKKSVGRRRQNGEIALNAIFERVENSVRNAEGFIAEQVPALVIKRVKEGVDIPLNIVPKNLAKPPETGLDFTVPVHLKEYKDVVKDQMYLQRIKQKCKGLKYHTEEEFLDDFRLIVSNTKAFHTTPAAQWVVQHAELLLEAAMDSLNEYRSEINTVLEQIEKAKQDPNSTGPEGSNANTPGPTTPGPMSPQDTCLNGSTAAASPAPTQLGDESLLADGDEDNRNDFALEGLEMEQDGTVEPLDDDIVNAEPEGMESLDADMPAFDLPASAAPDDHNSAQ